MSHFYNHALECCPKTTCKNNGDCKSCILKHKATDSLPYCLFPENGGDKSLKHFLEELQSHFESN